MLFKKIGNLFNQVDQDISSLALLGVINAAERTVKELQQEGPSWTGQFSNSWQITGPQGQQVKGDGKPGEPRPVKFMKAPFTGPQALRVLGRTATTKNKVVFKVSNFSPWAGYASDLVEGVFAPRTPEPVTQLGKSKWQKSGQSRPKAPNFRYEIYGGGAGEASRTAEKNWLTSYINGGKLDKAIEIEMDSLLRKS